MEIRGVPARFVSRQTALTETEPRMTKIPRMSWLARRALIRAGRRSGDPPTALRFLAIARLGLGRSCRRVANDLDVAPSTVVVAARRFLAEGAAGLIDRRCNN